MGVEDFQPLEKNFLTVGMGVGGKLLGATK